MSARSEETSAGGMAVRVINGVPSVALIGRVSRANAGRGGSNNSSNNGSNRAGPGRTARNSRLRWSMPKGHVEPGETLEQTAIREVREETGIVAEIVAPLGSMRYSFTSGTTRIHKRVHHFLMTALTEDLSDADAEVTEVAWVPVTRLPHVLAYAAERRIARRGAEILAASE